MLKPNQATQSLKQSGIRALGKRCAAVKGINLGQGICDLPTPEILKQQACDAITHGSSTYSACEGVFDLRVAIAEKLLNFNSIKADPEQEVMVAHGSTGAFVCAIQTLFERNDEIILFEPFYSYHKLILELLGMQIKTVPINLTDFSIDYDYLDNIISTNTKGIIICTPNNPSGKVYNREELLTLGKIADKHDLTIITDEIYEYIVYPEHEHVSLASLEDFKDRTITISGLSKTYNMTGWRLGYVTGPALIIEKMTLVQDLLYVCPVTPLQNAAIPALRFLPDYYEQMCASYLHKRDKMVSALQSMNYKITAPEGAYYLMADISELDYSDDAAAVTNLLDKAHVACVTGRSFYMNPNDGKQVLRFCYALDDKKIATALDQMAVIATRGHL
ncbi:MAG: pyridoxal phosphate-dependent aminotransferase [Gammaproteobacteria bacterium]